MTRTPLLNTALLRLTLCSIFMLLGCGIMDRTDETVRKAIEQTFGHLDDSLVKLDKVVDGQRAKLAGDLQTLVETTATTLQSLAEQAKQSVDAVLTAGQNLEEKGTADLISTMNGLGAMSDNLVAAVNSGVADRIKEVAKQVGEQRAMVLQQLNATVQRVLRPTLAQLTKTGDHYIGQVADYVTQWILRIVGGVLLVAALVGAVVVLRRPGRKAGMVVVAVSSFAGTALLAAPQHIARIGQPTVQIPSGEELCARMTATSARLKQAQADRAQSPRTMPASLRLRDRRPALAGTARNVKGLLRGAPPSESSPSTAGPTESDVPALASELLRDANQCITYATTGEMADLASQEFTRALALVTDNVICRQPSDCVILAKACDMLLGVCLARGVYCESHDDCELGFACNGQHRCVTHTLPCSTPADCRPEDSCDPATARCLTTAEVAAAHRSCIVPPPATGPCATGELQTVDRWVRCHSTVAAEAEKCDGVDNDCNGTIDDGVHTTTLCTASGVGQCAEGKRVCQNGGEVCVGTPPHSELCDGKDNDCNGAVDDVPSRGPCRIEAGTTGECANGQFFCRCVPAAPQPETCDNKDNDCDGSIDEGDVCDEVPVFDLTEVRHGLPVLGMRLDQDYPIAGALPCGNDQFGRPRKRTRCVAVESNGVNPSHCDTVNSGFGPGFLSGLEDDCRCRVHYGAPNDYRVSCRVTIFAR
jgi:ElaB/YqjD/DUF883 family membrane-anchored ribosome-binding protein